MSAHGSHNRPDPGASGRLRCQFEEPVEPNCHQIDSGNLTRRYSSVAVGVGKQRGVNSAALSNVSAAGSVLPLKGKDLSQLVAAIRKGKIRTSTRRGCQSALRLQISNLRRDIADPLVTASRTLGLPSAALRLFWYRDATQRSDATSSSRMI